MCMKSHGLTGTQMFTVCFSSSLINGSSVVSSCHALNVHMFTDDDDTQCAEME